MTRILITGSTDGIGLATAQRLAREGHEVVLHGRNQERLDAALEQVRAHATAEVAAETCDLGDLAAVDAFADAILERHPDLAVLINNAGVLGADAPTSDGLDPRFAINTVAPYLLTTRLVDTLPRLERVINLSSAAQAPVTAQAWTGEAGMADMSAYAQSKYAITAWTAALGRDTAGPMIVSVNPGSLLGTKMVKQGFGTDGNDIGIGVDVLVRAALGNEFAEAHGRYYDNDAGRFDDSVAAVTDTDTAARILTTMDRILAERQTT